ncbi:fimbria/pilus outer membrane usher protein [Phyllobacterium sp. OV277]|uniref:fimbria/pilus outer membrane usher protein n=1 Tax=Phyllobacterium sp. OV277 TaxID=1882772 RepID=UPI000884B63B|nr:fimbria/pilus outer membrane usher protein [Phyllobacterium sp. OV277]SDP80159.1 outer membrane usher protein [Phyllobacterium sp. OV277]
MLLTSQRPSQATKAYLATCMILAVGLIGETQAMAQDVSLTSQDILLSQDILSGQKMQPSQDLLLGVTVNDYPTGALVTFKRLPGGKLAAKPEDLRAAGIKPDRGIIGADGLIPLDNLRPVTWIYDEPRQIVIFTAPDDARVPASVDVGSSRSPVDLSAVRSDFGSVLNYTLYGTYGAPWRHWNKQRNTGSLSGRFESRILTPFGTFTNTALARMNAFTTFNHPDNGFTRLDSNWRYTDPKHSLVYQVGDSISSASSSGSSYRFGGIQINRNFSLRRDLVTSPVPSLSGTSSVPSTLDLYLNNIKVFSGEVPAGPFDVTNLPVMGGGGDARIVMKDALGRDVVTQQSYFFAPGMLGPGYVDFSAELGFPRIGYGNDTFSYDRHLAGSASVRYGLTNWLTLEGHGESTRGLINGSAGFVTSLGPFGSINASYSGSKYGDETGGKASAFYQVSHRGYSFYMGADRSFGSYNDVSLVVDRSRSAYVPLASRAREVDRIGISFPLGFDPSSLSLGYSRIGGAGKDGDSSILTASWSRTVFDKASVYLSAYADLSSSSKSGIYGGISFPLGDNMHASANLSRSGDHIGIDTSLSKSASQTEGSVGWSLHDHETPGGTGSRSASGSYRTRTANLSGSLDQSGDQGRITGTVEGSIVAAGGDIFFANRIDDAFAVVKAGGPDVDVSVNNRRVGTTNSHGRALVPYLRSYDNNTVAIDPTNLPLDLQPESTQVVVVPADRSGTVVDFGVKKTDAALVSLTGPDGQPLKLGAAVQLDGTDQTTIAGYEGLTWLTGLSHHNSLTVTLPEAAGTCHASFDYESVAGTQPTIGPVPCR